MYKTLKAAGLSDTIYAFCDKRAENKKFSFQDINVFPYTHFHGKDFVFIVTPIENKEIVGLLKKDSREYYTSFKKFASVHYPNTMYLYYKEFQINGDNELLNKAYKTDNYKVFEYDSTRRLCYIFFSGNGLYEPNTEGIFRKIIIEQDRYEWENAVQNSDIPNQAAKCIFIRDIRKNWYVSGINETTDSIDKLISLLHRLTNGYDVITVGASAGGYAATLLVIPLNAEMIFSFAGQFSLYAFGDIVSTEYFLCKYKDNSATNTYYDICKYVQGNIPIIYLYPKYSTIDVAQAKLATSLPNIFMFPINSAQHAHTLSLQTRIKLISKSLTYITELHEKYKDTVIDADTFQIE